MGISASANGLRRVTLPRRSRQEVRQLLGDIVSTSSSACQLQDVADRLRLYFDGHEVDFPDRLDLSEATHFQREVWRATRLIPYGETRSYGYVAARIGKPGAARAVGQALGRNPFPIVVPCHRVLAGDSKLGGFSGGLDMKRYLLSLEGAVISRMIPQY